LKRNAFVSNVRMWREKGKKREDSKKKGPGRRPNREFVDVLVSSRVRRQRSKRKEAMTVQYKKQRGEGGYLSATSLARPMPRGGGGVSYAGRLRKRMGKRKETWRSDSTNGMY